MQIKIQSHGTVPTTIAELEAAVKANLPNLQHGELYRLRDLVGHAIWNAMPNGARRQLGIKFRAQARAGGLPIRWVECKSSNLNIYQLR